MIRPLIEYGKCLGSTHADCDAARGYYSLCYCYFVDVTARGATCGGDANASVIKAPCDKRSCYFCSRDKRSLLQTLAFKRTRVEYGWHGTKSWWLVYFPLARARKNARAEARQRLGSAMGTTFSPGSYL